MFRNRLKEARKRKGWTQEQLAALLGVAKSTLAGYESGNSEPDMARITLMMKVLNVDANYLLQDEMQMHKRSGQTIDSNERTLIKQYRHLDTHGKKVVGALLDLEYERCTKAEQSDDAPESPALVDYRRYTSPAAAGTPLWAESEYEIISCNPDDVPAGADYAVGIQGASMEPDVPDGATVWVHRSEQPEDGDIVIAWVEGEGTVCKQAVCDGDQIVRLHSINPAYPDIEGEDLEGLRVYGVVVGMME